MHTTIFPENLTRRDYFGDVGIGGKIVLKYIVKLWGIGMWTGFIWIKEGPNSELL
jgi:hypothetical protein